MHILPLILGDVLRDSPHYECFLKLHDICAVALSPMLSLEQIPFMRLMVQEYLATFTTLYENERPLTPKFHFLVHLPRLALRYVSYLQYVL